MFITSAGDSIENLNWIGAQNSSVFQFKAEHQSQLIQIVNCLDDPLSDINK